MALLGQASGGWTESSSALRLLNVVVRNSISNATDDAFTQTNPVGETTASTISSKVDTTVLGCLSGSVAFARPDQGSGYVGGPGTATIKAAILADPTVACGYHPVGVFINNANSYPWVNMPALASGVMPYVSAGGTFGNQLYETQAIKAIGTLAQGDALTYAMGLELVASLNGFLMPKLVINGAAVTSVDSLGATNALSAEMAARHSDTTPLGAGDAEAYLQKGGSTVIGVLKMVPDSTQSELVYDQRI